jgi:predicted dehydrogenase
MEETLVVRIGVIGVGFGARVHIPAYQKEGLEVVAVCASREERARAAAERFRIPYAFADRAEMLAMDGLDAVAVVVPQNLHHSVTMDVIAANKHVICEKPFATILADAREMWQAAEASGITAMVCHEFRFSPARARVKELIDDGYLGPLQSAFIKLMQAPRRGFSNRPYDPTRDDAELGGGLLWSQGSHNIDALRHWFGEIEWVSGNVFTHRGERTADGSTIQTSADDALTMTLGFADGGWANFTASYAVGHSSGMNIELYGRDGTLVTPHPNVGSPNPPPHATLVGAKVGDELSELEIPARLDPYDDEGHDGLMPTRMLAREFVRGIAEGVSPAPNFYDGYRCQQVLHAVRESAKSGRVIRIDAAP